MSWEKCDLRRGARDTLLFWKKKKKKGGGGGGGGEYIDTEQEDEIANILLSTLPTLPSTLTNQEQN